MNMTEQPTRIEGGLSDATKDYLSMFSIMKERMDNVMGIPKDVASNLNTTPNDKIVATDQNGNIIPSQEYNLG